MNEKSRKTKLIPLDSPNDGRKDLGESSAVIP